jgi:hypothetical protein
MLVIGCGTSAESSGIESVALEGEQAVAYNALLASMPDTRYDTVEACAAAWCTALESADRATQLSCVNEPERTAAFQTWNAGNPTPTIKYLRSLDAASEGDRSVVNASIERDGAPETLQLTLVRVNGSWYVTLAQRHADIAARLAAN